MNYNLFFYDGNRNAVVMTDMNGKELVIDCNKAEAQLGMHKNVCRNYDKISHERFLIKQRR